MIEVFARLLKMAFSSSWLLLLPWCRTLMVREGKAVEVESLSELGIYGTLVKHQGKVRTCNLDQAPPCSYAVRSSFLHGM